MEFFNSLNLTQIKGGTKLKQGDLGSVLSYSLTDENGQEITSFDNKTAYINLVLDDKIWFTTTTLVDISRVTFRIDKAIPIGLYYLEIKIDDYIFPSDRDSIILIEEGSTPYDLKELVPNYDINMTLKSILSDLSQKGIDISDLNRRIGNVNAQLAEKVNKDEVTNVMTPKGTLAYASLPTSGNQVGWYYYCPDGDGTHGAGNYVWNGTSWFFGGTGNEGYNLLKKDLVKQVKIVNSESPIKEIISLNIINRDAQFIDGYYYDINGNLVANASYYASYFVKIKPNTQYYNNTNANVIIYDIGLNKIASYSGRETPFTTPNDAKYIKYAFLKNEIKKVRICEVNSNHPFINAYELNSVGKKLLQRSLYNLSHSVDCDVISLNGYLKTTGTIEYDSNLYGKYTTPIPCNVGDKFNYRGLGEYSVASCLYLNESLEIIGYNQYNATTKSVIVTVPSNTKYIQFSSYSTSNNVVLEFSAIGGDNSNVLSGKKYVSCGDSFTEGDFTGLSTEEKENCKDKVRGIYKTYPCLIANRNKMEYIQKAVCGGTTKSFYKDILTTVPTDADYITIAYGLNDYTGASSTGGKRLPIGTIDDDVSSNTFYGYWNGIMNWLITNCTRAHIGIIIMPAYMGNDYRVAQENIAKKYGVGVINLYSDKNAPMFMNKDGADSTIQNILYDRYKVSDTNGHPNLEAHERISYCIENWLRSI